MVGSTGQRNICNLRCSERTHDGTNRSVQSKEGNCGPWLAFMISGGPNWWLASFSAQRQNPASSVFEMGKAKPFG